MENKFFQIKSLSAQCSFLIFIFLLILPSRSIAQTGTDYYKKGEYAAAIAEFEKELKKSPTRVEQGRIEAHMGMSYYYINQPKEAISWLKKGFTHSFKSAEAYCVYGLSLQKMENYVEALEAFQECLKSDKNYPNVNTYIESCNYALDHPDPNAQIVLRSSKKANTDGSEYGISPAANGEIFFSRTPLKGNIDPRTGMAYTEVYVSTLEGNDLSKPKKEKAFMKAFFNTGVFTYDAKSNCIYMTMCDPKSGKCGIYKSDYNRKKWGTPEPFFTNDKFDMAHPAVAKGGNRLYFVSNAPGGYGKTDIWYADRISGDKWTEPINAGPTINTAGRDEFPFVEGDSILYFASDGHPGFGGLDIFAAAIDDDQIGKPMNIGRPFNSGADDFNLVTEGDKGLMISSRNLRTNDDIYIFNKSDLPKPEHTKKPKVEPEPEPEPEIIMPEPEVAVVEPTPEPEPQPQPEIKRPEPKPETCCVIVIYFDFDKFVPQREFRDQYEEIVARMKAYPNARFELAGHADERGGEKYNDELSDKRAEYIAKRLIDRGMPRESIVTRGYGYFVPAVPNAHTEDEYQKNRRVEIKIITQ